MYQIVHVHSYIQYLHSYCERAYSETLKDIFNSSHSMFSTCGAQAHSLRDVTVRPLASLVDTSHSKP